MRALVPVQSHNGKLKTREREWTYWRFCHVFFVVVAISRGAGLSLLSEVQHVDVFLSATFKYTALHCDWKSFPKLLSIFYWICVVHSKDVILKHATTFKGPFYEKFGYKILLLADFEVHFQLFIKKSFLILIFFNRQSLKINLFS